MAQKEETPWCHSSSIQCSACSALEEAKRRTTTVRNHFETLIHEEHQAYCRLNSTHDPFQKLPVEIAWHIFEADTTRMLHEIFALGAICRYWREIAWSTPTLWNRVEIMFAGHENKNQSTLEQKAGFIREVFQRSGSLPLEIDIRLWVGPYTGNEGSKVNFIVDALIDPRVISRISQLWLRLPPSCWSKLNGVQAPKLRKLTLEAAAVNQPPDDVPSGVDLCSITRQVVDLGIFSLHLPPARLSCKQLVRLRAKNYIQFDFVEMMKKADNLRSCEISVSGCGSLAPLLGYHETHVHPHLNSMKVRIVNGQRMDCLLQPFSFPGFQSLSVDSKNIDFQTILSLVHRSHCSLTHIYLRDETLKFSKQDLCRLLELLPNLTNLDIGYVKFPSTLTDIFYAVFSSESSYRPKLQHFTCGWERSILVDHNYWDFIPEIFDATSLQNELAKNISVKLRASTPSEQLNNEYLLVPQDAMQVIKRLEAMGWRWSLEYFGYGGAGDLLQKSLA